MQKVINVLALASFGLSAAIVGAGAYVYLNRDAMVESVKKQMIEQVTKSVSGALPGMVQGSMPKLPTQTGGVLNSKPAIPGL